MLDKVATTTTCWLTFSYLPLRYHVRPPLLELNRMNSTQTSLVPAKLHGSFGHIRDPTPRDNASNNQGIRRSRLPQYSDAAMLHRAYLIFILVLSRTLGLEQGGSGLPVNKKSHFLLSRD